MKLISRRSLSAVATILVSVGLAAAATSGHTANAASFNLVKNGDFSPALNNWKIPAQPDGTVTAAGGHAVIDVTSVTAGASSVGATQCVTGIVPGATYQITTDVLIPSGQKRAGFGAAYVNFNSGASCNGGIPAGISTPQWPGADGAWHTRSSSIVAPANAKSAVVGFAVTRHGTDLMGAPGDPYQVWFDNIALTTESAPPVPPTSTLVPPKKTPAPLPPTPTPTDVPPPFDPPVIPPIIPPVTGTDSGTPPPPVGTPTKPAPPKSTPTQTGPTSVPSGPSAPPSGGQALEQEPSEPSSTVGTEAPLPPQTGTTHPVHHGSKSVQAALGLSLLAVGAATYGVSRRYRA